MYSFIIVSSLNIAASAASTVHAVANTCWHIHDAHVFGSAAFTDHHSLFQLILKQVCEGQIFVVIHLIMSFFKLSSDLFLVNAARQLRSDVLVLRNFRVIITSFCLTRYSDNPFSSQSYEV